MTKIIMSVSRLVVLYHLQYMTVQVGQHEGDMPIEKMDINGSGEIVASIG